jgi:pimeloyl-ACP methyl ester carboxylesterase
MPILLLHGFAEDHRIWVAQADALAGRWRLILPDLPGSGSSALLDDLSMESMGDCMRALCEQELGGNGKWEAALVGHSMGGYVALSMVEKDAGPWLGLGLFHSTAFSDTEERKEARSKAMEFMAGHGSLAFLRQSTPNLFSAEFKSGHPEAVNETIVRYATIPPETLSGYYRAMQQRPDRSRVLAESGLPCLFVIGKEDKAILPEDSFRQSRLPQVSHIHFLEHTAHMGMMEEPENSTRILDGFLASLKDSNHSNG